MSATGNETLPAPPSRVLHRLAVLAVCLVWPLIWVGGLVTTYDAGMAVPDWPGTYGYNLFLYPIDTWLWGPFDLFIEHGHRLLGAVVGLVAIAMVVASLWDSRRWVQGLCVALLLAVISQGVLGGLRVVLSDRTLAMTHGCLGPAVFCLFVVAAVVTSRFWWQSRLEPGRESASSPAGWVALVASLVILSYLQLFLGAQIRHIQPNSPPSRFAMIVVVHVATALLLWLLTGVNWIRLRRCGDLTLSRPALVLIGLVAVQIVLGVGTWVVSYGWPSFLRWFPGAMGFLIRSKGFFDSIIVTAHVATGSLILAVSTLLLFRTLRMRWQSRRMLESGVAGSKSTPLSATT
jgi:cytochrome c oxidase assembly protein subunit 15